MSGPPIDFEEVVADATDNLDHVLDWLGLDGRREGPEFVAFNPTRTDRHLGSFRIKVTGSRRGRWWEHAQGTGGDVLALIAYVRGECPLEAARAYQERFQGSDQRTERPKAPKRPGRP